MTTFAQPDILYGSTPENAPPLWVAILADLPDAVAVLEKHGFEPTEIGDLALFTPPDGADELVTVVHVASYAELVHLGHAVMQTADHPALPAERLQALIDLGPDHGTAPGTHPGEGPNQSGMAATLPPDSVDADTTHRTRDHRH
ncbi:hypothetical protein ACFQ8Q_00040 [Streptomyces cyaneofuscatus]|uniref:hypothetical protein n=1 Tax=Streptomyces cyaneofuscatus TaxID=66883 RepID=UPI003689D8AD